MAVGGWAALRQASVVGGGVPGSLFSGPRQLGMVRQYTSFCGALCVCVGVGDCAWGVSYWVRID